MEMKNFLPIFFALSIVFVSQTATGQAANPDSVYTIQEPQKQASFTGGEEAWIEHLINYLDPSVPNINGAPKGNYTVVLNFVVTKNGTIKNIFAETKHGYGMETEAIRVLKSSPKWTPAEVNGQKVNSYKTQAFNFDVGKKRKS